MQSDRGRAGRAGRAGSGGLPCRGDPGGVVCAVRFRRAAGLGGGPALWRGAEPADLARRTVGADYGPDRMRRLVLALQLMTRLPLPAQHVDERGSEEHTYELQSLMSTSYAVLCLKKKMT